MWHNYQSTIHIWELCWNKLWEILLRLLLWEEHEHFSLPENILLGLKEMTVVYIHDIIIDTSDNMR